MNSKKKKNFISNLDLLTDKVLKYSKQIPLYNCFIDKKTNIVNNRYGVSNHIEQNITNMKHNYKFNNNISNATEFIKCKKVILCIKDSYKNKLLQCFADYIDMYNTVIKYFNKNGYSIYDFRKIRSKLKDEKKKYSAPSHVLDGAIKLGCTSLKSALTNKKNKNIKDFKLKTIKHNKKSKIIDVEQCYFKSEYIFKRFLKEKIKNTENYDYTNINCDCKIHYNVKKDRFTLLIPIKTKIKEVATENQISIDMGQRTFITGLTNNKIIEIGTTLSNSIENSLKRVDRYEKLIDEKKRNNITKKRGIEKLITKKETPNRKLKRRVREIRTKIKNRIKDTHWKIINYLTKTYKNITVGNWSTKDCIKKETSKLGKMNKRIVSTMSVYRFKERLKYKSESRKINLQIVNEAYTTQMCSYCSKLDKQIGSSKIYDCRSCGKKLDRDVNSCRNMMMLGLE